MNLQTCSQIAREAGVQAQTVHAATQGGRRLAAAVVMSAGKKRIDREHPATVDYLRRRSRVAPRTRAVTPVALPQVAADDPFLRAAELAPPPVVAAELCTPTVVEDIAQQVGGEVLELSGLTLRECVARWGSLPAMSEAVKAMKLEADMVVRRQQAAKASGETISRALVESTLVVLVESAFRRLVIETPAATAEQAVALVLADRRGAELGSAVEELLRRENGRILGGCRDALRAELGKM